MQNPTENPNPQPKPIQELVVAAWHEKVLHQLQKSNHRKVNQKKAQQVLHRRKRATDYHLSVQKVAALLVAQPPVQPLYVVSHRRVARANQLGGRTKLKPPKRRATQLLRLYKQPVARRRPVVLF